MINVMSEKIAPDSDSVNVIPLNVPGANKAVTINLRITTVTASFGPYTYRIIKVTMFEKPILNAVPGTS